MNKKMKKKRRRRRRKETFQSYIWVSIGKARRHNTSKE